MKFLRSINKDGRRYMHGDSRLLKKTQRRGARSSHMADSLWHIVGTIRYKPAGARRLSATKHMEAHETSAAC
jgi:hypothetical protein